ncbi:MAG: GlgB N-terminal domain-containing protein, partial [Cyanobacteriota bacterium]
MKRISPKGSFSGTTLPPEDLHPLLECRHSDPHRILGVRPGMITGSEIVEGGSVARVFYPGATAVTLRGRDGQKTALIKGHADGLFEVAVPDSFPVNPDEYTVEAVFSNGLSHSYSDPYAFAPTLGDVDLYLLGQGEHLESYRVLGAHLKTISGITGTSFAVWAPNAQRVSVVGDFNGWDGRRHMMRRLGGSGIGEIFVPGVAQGNHYKFEIRGPSVMSSSR